MLFGLCCSLAGAATVADSALAWWSFEGGTTGTNGYDLTPVGSTTSTLTPAVPVSYESVSGMAAAGGEAVKLDGATVFKTNAPQLRLGGAQTFWLRVNLSSVSGTVALMDRSRALNGSRGISLQMTEGALAAYVSGDGQSYTAGVTDSSYVLSTGTWYDISLRFTPSESLVITIYDPITGSLLDSVETTTNVPASIVTTNSIGNGYFQIGGINAGSSGSSWVAANGTLIEAAGVWNTALTDAQLASLSAAAVPEPANVALIAGGLVLLGCLALRRRLPV